MIKKWMYSIREWTDDQIDVQDDLANFGLDGWELIHVTDYTSTLIGTKCVRRYFFKREIK
jgi:hypothetical protein